MVFRSVNLLAKKKIRRSEFIDTLRLYVCGGSGGNGLPSYGGVGGKGGDVIAIAEEGVELKDVKRDWPDKRVIAGAGGHSSKNALLGNLGSDVKVKVPIGITILNDFKQVIGELNSKGSQVVLARGGPGGSSVNQFLGLQGDKFPVNLDLKLIADVGFVGFPNAGKSSLLRVISNAKPRVASYPFTTIRPNIGIVKYNDFRQITMADLPGLIEGSHINVGMGHKFLKHVERTRLLMVIVDIMGFQLNPKYPKRSAFETIVLLNKELELYKESLIEKPALLVVSKMDIPGAEKNFKELKEKLKEMPEILTGFPEATRPEKLLNFDDIVTISSKEDPRSINKLKSRVKEILDFHAESSQLDSESELLEEIRIRNKETGPCLF